MGMPSSDKIALILNTGLLISLKKLQKSLTHFMPLIFFDNPMKTSEKTSDVFRRYQKRSVAWNGLMGIFIFCAVNIPSYLFFSYSNYGKHWKQNLDAEHHWILTLNRNSFNNWTFDVNWTNIRRSEDALNVSCQSYVRSIYFLYTRRMS